MDLAADEIAYADDLAARAPSMGYLRARVLPDGSVAATLDLLFTRAICLGLHEFGWTTRYCFEDRALADQQFDKLHSEDEAPAGAVACSVTAPVINFTRNQK